MGDMADDFRFMRQGAKKRRANAYERNIPFLKGLGATEMTSGVWRLGEFDFYPRGWARNYKTGESYSFPQAIKLVKKELLT